MLVVGASKPFGEDEEEDKEEEDLGVVSVFRHFGARRGLVVVFEEFVRVEEERDVDLVGFDEEVW